MCDRLICVCLLIDSSFITPIQLPGPFPITNVDLAEFTLGALRTEKLYNTCPYVVQNGI